MYVCRIVQECDVGQCTGRGQCHCGSTKRSYFRSQSAAFIAVLLLDKRRLTDSWLLEESATDGCGDRASVRQTSGRSCDMCACGVIRRMLMIYALNEPGLWPPTMLAVAVMVCVGKQLATSINRSNRSSVGSLAASFEPSLGVCR